MRQACPRLVGSAPYLSRPMQSLRSAGVILYPRPGIGIATAAGAGAGTGTATGTGIGTATGYGSGVIGGHRPGRKRRSLRPFVGPLTHSRKLYSSKEADQEPGPEPSTPLEPSPAPAHAPASTPTLAPTPASVLLAPRLSRLDSFTIEALCPTTANPTSSCLQRRRPNTSPTSRASLSSIPNSKSHIRLYSFSRTRLATRATASSARSSSSSSAAAPPLPIMYEGKWTALTVRKTFLDYFAERGHTIGMIPV